MNQGVASTTQRLNIAFDPQSVSANGDDVYHDIGSSEYAYASVNKTRPSPTANEEGSGYTYASVNKTRWPAPTADKERPEYASVNKARPTPTADEGGNVYAYADVSTFRPRPSQPDAEENCVENGARTIPGDDKGTASPGDTNDQDGWQENTVYATASKTEEGWAENDIYNLE